MAVWWFNKKINNCKCDLTKYYTKQEIQAMFSEYYTKLQVDDLLSSYITTQKVNELLQNYYTKEEVDKKISDISGGNYTNTDKNIIIDNESKTINLSNSISFDGGEFNGITRINSFKYDNNWQNSMFVRIWYGYIETEYNDNQFRRKAKYSYNNIVFNDNETFSFEDDENKIVRKKDLIGNKKTIIWSGVARNDGSLPLPTSIKLTPTDSSINITNYPMFINVVKVSNDSGFPMFSPVNDYSYSQEDGYINVNVVIPQNEIFYVSAITQEE